MKNPVTNNQIVIIILLLLGAGLLYLLAPILMPFFAGALLAYLSNPLVNKLMYFHLSRNVAAVIVFLCLFFILALFFVLLIPFIQKQAVTLSVALPNMVIWVQAKVLSWLAHYNMVLPTINIDDFKRIIAENAMKTGDVATWLLHSGKTLFEWMINLILIPVVTFYLLRDWDDMIKSIRKALPNRIRLTVVKITKECDAILGAFFRGQLLVMLFLAIYYSITLSALGLQLGIVIGLIVGLASIVPYLGLFIGLAIAAIASLVQFGTLNALLWVLFIFLIGHSIENFYLTPKLIGGRIGLHPVVVIFAILAGGTLFGFFGILLALPAAAVAMVFLRYLLKAS